MTDAALAFLATPEIRHKWGNTVVDTVDRFVVRLRERLTPLHYCASAGTYAQRETHTDIVLDEPCESTIDCIVLALTRIAQYQAVAPGGATVVVPVRITVRRDPARPNVINTIALHNILPKSVG